MIKRYEMEDSAEMIQGFSDKELIEYLADARFLRSAFREFAINERNRRQLNKITKSTSKIGNNTWLTIIGFGIIGATFLFTVFKYFVE